MGGPGSNRSSPALRSYRGPALADLVGVNQPAMGTPSPPGSACPAASGTVVPNVLNFLRWRSTYIALAHIALAEMGRLAVESSSGGRRSVITHVLHFN